MTKLQSAAAHSATDAERLADLCTRTGAQLEARDMRLVTAESCTGGLIAARLTDVSGASAWFEGAFVTYRLSAKQRMLGVDPATLARHGAVSEPTVREMCEGALRGSDADISVAVSGVAGPDGGEVTTPVGTVWLGWALRSPRQGCVQTAVHVFDGDRNSVRRQAAEAALNGVLTLLT